MQYAPLTWSVSRSQEQNAPRAPLHVRGAIALGVTPDPDQPKPDCPAARKGMRPEKGQSPPLSLIAERGLADWCIENQPAPHVLVIHQAKEMCCSTPTAARASLNHQTMDPLPTCRHPRQTGGSKNYSALPRHRPFLVS